MKVNSDIVLFDRLFHICVFFVTGDCSFVQFMDMVGSYQMAHFAMIGWFKNTVNNNNMSQVIQEPSEENLYVNKLFVC